MEGCNIIIHNPSAKDAYGSPYMQGTYPYRRHTAFPISTYMLRYQPRQGYDLATDAKIAKLANLCCELDIICGDVVAEVEYSKTATSHKIDELKAILYVHSALPEACPL